MMTSHSWLSCKSKSSVTGLMPQKIALDNSSLHACENALANFDIIWPFLSPRFFKTLLRREIQRPWVGKEIQEHGVEMMLINVTYTQVNTQVKNSSTWVKTCTITVHPVCCETYQYFFHRLDVTEDLYCILIDLPSYNYEPGP